MKISILILVITFVCYQISFGQIPNSSKIEQININNELTADIKDSLEYEIVETDPIYKDGGKIGMLKFLMKNMYLLNSEIELLDNTIVRFVVDTLGIVSNIEVLKGGTPSFDEEIVRVFQMMTFIPGTRYGKPFKMKMTLPLRICLK